MEIRVKTRETITLELLDDLCEESPFPEVFRLRVFVSGLILTNKNKCKINFIILEIIILDLCKISNFIQIVNK